MKIKWRSISEHPTDRWERNKHISNPKLVLYQCDGETKLGWAQYSYICDDWIILTLCYTVIAWADISEEEFNRIVKEEINL